MLESRTLGLMPFLENRVSMCLEAQVLFYASLLVRFFLRWSLIFFSLKYPLLQRDSSFTWRLYGLSITPWTRELSNLKLLLSITEMKENKIRFWHKEGTPMSPWNQNNSIMFTDLKELIKPYFVMAKLISVLNLFQIYSFSLQLPLFHYYFLISHQSCHSFYTSLGIFRPFNRNSQSSTPASMTEKYPFQASLLTKISSQ